MLLDNQIYGAQAMVTFTGLATIQASALAKSEMTTINGARDRLLHQDFDMSHAQQLHGQQSPMITIKRPCARSKLLLNIAFTMEFRAVVQLKYIFINLRLTTLQDEPQKDKETLEGAISLEDVVPLITYRYTPRSTA
ncbi:hypothetical protein BX616_010495 [Lobosporangium transversale]|nr:hypothetical protein BX616_010495 [Lobosporangium transversale]